METQALKKIIVIGFLFLIFPPHLILYGVYIKTVYISVVIPALFGLYFFIITKKINKLIIFTLYTLVFQLLFFIINYKLNLYQDNSILIRQLQGFTCFFASYFYIFIINKCFKSSTIPYEDIVYKQIVYATTINSIILLFTKFSPSFKEILYNYVVVSDLAHLYMFNFKEIGRFQGIVYSGFSFLSTVYGVVISINLVLINKYKFSKILISSLLINIIALMDIGRSGYVPILILFLIFISYFIINKKKLNFDYIYKLSYIFVPFCFYIIFFHKDIKWLLEPFNFFNYYDKNTIGNLLSHTINFPNNLIFGNGNFGFYNNFPSLNTDLGFEILINGSGISGLITAFLLVVPIFLIWNENWFNSQLKILTSLILLSFVILSFKDYYYYGYGDIFQIYFLIIFSSLFNDNSLDNPFYYNNILKFFKN